MPLVESIWKILPYETWQGKIHLEEISSWKIYHENIPLRNELTTIKNTTMKSLPSKKTHSVISQKRKFQIENLKCRKKTLEKYHCAKLKIFMRNSLQKNGGTWINYCCQGFDKIPAKKNYTRDKSTSKTMIYTDWRKKIHEKNYTLKKPTENT